MKDLITEEYVLEIIPSPGTMDKEWAGIEKKLESLKGVCSTVHIDIIDGKFAPNTTFIDPKPFSKYKSDFILEAHFMVENPLHYLKPFSEAGFQRFIGQIEKMPDVDEFIASAQILGEVGLALDVKTEISILDKVDLDNLDCLTVMTVQAGFSGQKFMENMLEKVKKLREKTLLPIEVDGGIKDTNILFAKNAGANRFVSTSFLWNSESPAEAYKKLKNIIYS